MYNTFHRLLTRRRVALSLYIGIYWFPRALDNYFPIGKLRFEDQIILYCPKHIAEVVQQFTIRVCCL